MNYLTLTDPNNTYTLDIETDSLTPTLIWCCVIKNKGTGEIWRFKNPSGDKPQDTGAFYSELRSFFTERPTAIWVGHNILSFDGYNIGKLCGFDWLYPSTVDTLVLSYLYNPALDGGHSLEAYGYRLKFPKGDHSDWSKYSEEMLEYCERDVNLTELVYDALTKKMLAIGFSTLSCEIEHKIRVIIDKQQRNGFYFDRHSGEVLLHQLREREADLANQIHKLFPPELKEVGTYTKRVRKDGSDFASYERHVGSHNLVKDNGNGTYSCFDYSAFNIGSPKQRLERLLSVGFKPTAKTKKGNPKVDEDSLVAFAQECGRPEIQAMADWLVHNGRANMVENWLGYVESDSRVRGRVFTCGATSRRMTHNSPNLANIPSAHNGAMYGDECRSLWTVPPNRNRVLVGYDAKGLETHVLCHHLANKKATELLLEGDVHQVNAEALSLRLGFPVVRGGGGAKTLLYAAIFGAYPAKLGSILKKGSDVGEVVQEVLFETIPGYKKLIRRVDEEYKSNGGLLRTIDGGYVRCPSPHAALNYHIQPDGGILMKYTSILLDKRLYEKGLEHLKVVDVHDESQHEVDESDAEELGKIAVQCITDAGEELGFRVRMSGSYKIGKAWNQTH